MRIFTTLPQEDLRKVGPAAKAIEAAGYTGVSTQENKHEPFLSLAVAGADTERLELHTGVAIAFARSPMAVANIGWDMAASYREASRCRRRVVPSPRGPPELEAAARQAALGQCAFPSTAWERDTRCARRLQRRTRCIQEDASALIAQPGFDHA